MIALYQTIFFLCVFGTNGQNIQEKYFQDNRRLAKAIVEALQDSKFDDEILFDLKKENQIYLNRTMSLIIKYIVKREVDNYRARRTDAISRRIYSSLIMKLIDIAKHGKMTALCLMVSTVQTKNNCNHRVTQYPLLVAAVLPACEELDMYRLIPKRDPQKRITMTGFFAMYMDLPSNTSASNRIETAHRYYMTVENRDMHDQMADVQVFHACVRLYDIMFTVPRIITHLGNLDDLTPRLLMKKLKEIEVKPVHLGVALLIQYHLRNTVNFAIRSKTLDVLSTKPQMVGAQVIEMLKALAARLLPIAELLDVHLAHSSPAFKDTCPATWLGIVNNKQP